MIERKAKLRSLDNLHPFYLQTVNLILLHFCLIYDFSKLQMMQ